VPNGKINIEKDENYLNNKFLFQVSNWYFLYVDLAISLSSL
jgi:hypothetical protein